TRSTITSAIAGILDGAGTAGARCLAQARRLPAGLASRLSVRRAIEGSDQLGPRGHVQVAQVLELLVFLFLRRLGGLVRDDVIFLIGNLVRVGRLLASRRAGGLLVARLPAAASSPAATGLAFFVGFLLGRGSLLWGGLCYLDWRRWCRDEGRVALL